MNLPGNALGEARRQCPPRPSGQGMWWVPLAAVLALAVGFGVARAFQVQYARIQAAAAERAALAEELRQAEARRAQLLQEIQRLQTPSHLEALARERLGYIRPGETPYMALGDAGAQR